MWILLAFFGILLLYYFFKIRFDHWNKLGVSTASGCHWFFGHYKHVILKTQHLRDMAQEIYDEFPDAPVVGFFKLHTPGLFIRDPDVIKTVLISQFSNFISNGFFKDRKYDILAGCNPFFSNAEDWKTLRGHSSAALTQAKLRGYLPRMRAVGAALRRRVAGRCAGAAATVDAKYLATTFTTDVLGAAVCGVASESFSDPNSLFARLTREVGSPSPVAHNLKDALQSAWPLLNRIFRMRATSVKCEELLLHITRRVMQERTASEEKGDDLFQVAISFRKNDTKGEFTDGYISGLVYTVMLDQYDTSSQVIINALFALAWNPEVQERLRNELAECNFKVDGDYTMEEIENLNYLDMFLSETLRMFSAIPVLSRVCTSDCTLPIPGLSKPLKIIKGTPIIMASQAIHMDPKYYPVPHRFDPERFSQEEVDKRPKYTYLPFGEGPKRCPGFRLAALQIKVAIMTLVKHFRLRPAAGSKFPLDIDPGAFVTACPEPPYDLAFEPIANHDICE